MTAVLHLVVGPDGHGVVRHATAVANACGHAVARVVNPAAAMSYDGWPGFDVVHVAFTDRIFGATCEQAARVFAELAASVAAAGAALSVTLHDVPRGETPLQCRRRVTYRSVVAAARGVVACSRVELAAVEAYASGVHSLREIALPVEPTTTVAAAEPAGRDVVVLGFVFPDRGYEDVLRELPAGTGLLALGGAAVGHEDLPHRLARLAAESGVSWRVSGFVPDGELAACLAGAAVPVAPNVRVGASGSIGTWLANGRRPIVPRTEYTEELAARMPDSVQFYDADQAGSLRAAVSAALADPTRTRLPPSLTVGPGLAEVADAYLAHFTACAPPPPGLIPDNRWDLLPPATVALPTVSVIIPYYEDQPRLELILAALREQTVAERIEIIVADDGSRVPPDVSGAGNLPVCVVRQARRGFGAARARNLGAGRARGPLLAFLDGDTIPEPSYLERLLDGPHRHPDVLVVGRRRHASFDGWTAADITSWLRGHRVGPRELPEPAWLHDGYAGSANLRDAGPRGYRFVISAVLALHRSLFERLGGFEESFTSYGGEDWELANRAWHAGAFLAHEPSAVAWHDGPDWAQRRDTDRRAAKNAETLALCRLLPDPHLRGGGPWSPYPHIAVRLHLEDTADAMVTVRSALAGGADCGFWTGGDRMLDVPFVHAGVVPEDVLSRAAVLVDVTFACDLSDLASLADEAQRHGLVRAPALTARSVRAIRRGHDDATIELLFGRHDRSAPRCLPAVDLAAQLPRVGQPVRRS